MKPFGKILVPSISRRTRARMFGFALEAAHAQNRRRAAERCPWG